MGVGIGISRFVAVQWLLSMTSLGVGLGLLLGLLAARGDELPKNPEAINRLTAISPEQARWLATRAKGGVMHLSGLSSLSAEATKSLTGSDSKIQALFLNGLTTLSSDTVAVLAEFKGRYLGLNGLSAISTDEARMLATCRVASLQLDGLTTLPADAADALAEFKGAQLSLRGLTTLDTETARALSRAKSWNGHLPKLTGLSADTARALGVIEGPILHLEGLATLDAQTADALARCPKWSGSLAGVVCLEADDSVAVAAALARRQGNVALPNLKRISPRTLTALIEKRDIVIPPLEKLELIREPDGGSSDDFVVPDDFPDRRRRPHGR